MKVQIDLCELFEVKEGQEFYIDSHEVKYKIENNKLMVGTINGWGKSKNNIAWLSQLHDIEILKPKLPEEVKKMFEACLTLGYTELNYTYDFNQDEDCWNIYNGESDSEIVFYKENKIAKWFEKNLSKGYHTIQNILDEYN